MIRARYKVDASPLFRAMKRALRNGVATPYFHIGPLRFSWWEAGRMREGGRLRKVPIIHVTYQGKYVGRIEHGHFLTNGFGFDTLNARREVAKQIRLIVAHPKEAAAADAAVSDEPRCVCCGRLLGRLDARTGIGAKCSFLWGWPNAKEG